MNTSEWFGTQLQASAQGFEWGARQVPVERQFVQPPNGLGEWSAARHVLHMMFYEQTLALPSMRQWLGEPCPSLDGPDEDDVFRQGKCDYDALLAEFSSVRSEQIALLERFDEATWHTTRSTLWGPITLLWLVSKTYQHTAEHLSDVMRIALFWDHFAEQQKEQNDG